MFFYCTSLESAPVLPATTLSDWCYFQMFSYCKKLSTVTMLGLKSEITSKSACVTNWLYNAGTDETVKSRTLKVTDEAAYTALESYLPAIWQKDAEGTTVLYENNGK